MNPDLFPVLSAKDIVLTSLIQQSADPAVVPIPGFSWLVVMQHESDADKALLSHLAKFPLDPKNRGQIPFENYPQFSSKGVGALLIPDAAWIALVRRGNADGSHGPNSTEAQIAAFIKQFGTQTKRR